MEKLSIAKHTGGGGGKEPQGRQGFLSKIPFFKFFTNSKFSVSNVNKSNVGVETPTYIKNCNVRIWKKSVNNFSCHPELVSGSSHRQKCVTICTVSGKEVLDKVGWAFSPTLKYCWGRNPNLQKAISYASRTATRHLREDLVPAFTLAEVFSPYYHSPRRVAFTLAEVLITLGIIGVVAAMTLPTLVQHYKRQEASARLKKFYSAMSQAIKLSETDNGEIKYWEKIEQQYLEDGSSDTLANSELSYNFFMKYLEPYIKYTKIDKAVAVDDPENSYEYEVKVYLSDGSLLYMHNGDCMDIC